MARLNQFGKRVVLLMLRGYKWAISPMFPPACRFVPTCSEYAMEAVERFGALRGGWMAVGRVLRCHPLARGGHDPVVRGAAGSESAVVDTPFEGGDGAGEREVPRLRMISRFAEDHAPLGMTKVR